MPSAVGSASQSNAKLPPMKPAPPVISIMGFYRNLINAYKNTSKQLIERFYPFIVGTF